MNNTFLIIDGSSFIFRAFHALPNLSAPDGKLVNAIYGVINMLKQMKKNYPVKYWACVFDTPGKTFRDNLYPEYKATRKKTPIELLEQLEDIYQIVAALGIPVIMQSGIEADDIIGTLAVKARNSGQKVIIASGDKDFAQLVDQNILLTNTLNNEQLDSQGVFNKFGVYPEQIVDYLTLIGDKIDNIPGVEKCGPKTASKWLQEYTTLENLIQNKDKLTGVVGENFRNSISWLTTAKTLVTIDTQVDLSKILPSSNLDLELQIENLELLHSFYTRLGFKSFLRQITEQSNLAINPELEITTLISTTTEKKSHTINKPTELDDLITKLIKANQTISISILPDYNTTPPFIKTVVISESDGDIYIVHNQQQNNNDDANLFNDDNDNTTNSKHNYLAQLNKLFTSNIAKVMPNYKEILQILTKWECSLRNVIGDVVLAHYLKDSKQNHSLVSIYREFLDIDIIDLYKPTKAKNDEDLKLQSCIDIASHAISMEKSISQSLDPLSLKLYKELELPLTQILVNIENVGIKLDIVKFHQLEKILNQKITTLEEKIYAESGCVFNINSPKQLQDVLFTQLNLPTIGLRKNTTGYSTDEDSLKYLENQGLYLGTLLLEYRTLSKLLNTYVAKLPKVADKLSRVHTTFEQAVVASGRLSSKDPNLQNIPIRNDWGKQIRSCFIADSGTMLICADYSQIELRILAHYSNDENLINAFNNNQDIHSITASEIFNKPLADVTKDERRYAKIINFSLLYGKTAFGLAQELNIELHIAKQYIDTYFAKYPKIKACLEGIKAQSRTQGYISTVFGRRIYLPNINAQNKFLREAEERLALNAPMQGTSADIIKFAMYNINKWLLENKLQTKMILQVHDELILQAPLAEVNFIKDHLTTLMTQNISLNVKLSVDIKVANNWDDAH